MQITVSEKGHIARRHKDIDLGFSQTMFSWLVKARNSFRKPKVTYFLSAPKLCEVLNQVEPYNGRDPSNYGE
jgi:hypothetical protein